MKNAASANGSVLLYERVMQRILANISDGLYTVGDQLPNENELCTAFSVSRITVRRAVDELVKKGFLEKRQGKGTFVTSPTKTLDIREVSSFHAACRRLGLKASTRLIHVREVAADEADQRELGMLPGQKVIEIVRVCYAGDLAVTVEKNHFSTAYSYLTECDLEGSLYNLLREFGVEAKNAVHDISIRPAAAPVTKWLGVTDGAPLLYLREVIYDQKGRPLHNSLQWIRGDRFTFRI